ncbi:hypothetical protein I79_025654 [Cricetulus griseus]|uniref:Uncharacterized protein n=1 Tax=Cricetulus griseus TaxID=10029 RepID=G3INW3_CRIGR|nr:hypothetical protein I79_025654 [Cricetulus griseus]
MWPLEGPLEALLSRNGFLSWRIFKSVIRRLVTQQEKRGRTPLNEKSLFDQFHYQVSRDSSQGPSQGRAAPLHTAGRSRPGCAPGLMTTRLQRADTGRQ